MKYEIRQQWTNELIYSTEAESWEQVIKESLSNGANLYAASLSGADLSYADLRGANLSGADLRGADLSYANLRDTNLRVADLSGADLRGANLSGANLYTSELSGASLSGANLSGADLSGANLPSPAEVLSAYWGEVSDALTAELMRYDAFFHPDPEAFTKWAQGGSCPFGSRRFQRAANFKEKKSLWVPGPCKNGYDLMVSVLREKVKTDL